MSSPKINRLSGNAFIFLTRNPLFPVALALTVICFLLFRYIKVERELQVRDLACEIQLRLSEFRRVHDKYPPKLNDLLKASEKGDRRLLQKVGYPFDANYHKA